MAPDEHRTADDGPVRRDHEADWIPGRGTGSGERSAGGESMTARRAIPALLAATVLVLAAAATSPVAAAATTAEPSVVVDLSADGSAEVSVTFTFDLDSDEERTAFEELRSNDSSMAVYEERFADRMAAVAANASAATDREMAIEGTDVAASTTDSTGVVTLTATWSGLAAVEGDRLVLTEPFASGFEPDRRFVVAVPDGYEVTETTPSPDERADGRLAWAAGTELDGFEVTMTTTDEGESGANGGSGGFLGGVGPGFGAVGALLGVVLIAVGAGLRSRRS